NDFSNSTVYQALSGAWVFASGTTDWSWALDNYDVPNQLDPRIQKATANILDKFVTPLNNFAITASPASQILPGGTANYNVTITPSGSFSDQVSLAVSGLPAGATGSFAPSLATAASTLSVTTSSSTPVGSYTLTITGTSGNLTNTTTVSLVVNNPDFTLSSST